MLVHEPRATIDFETFSACDIKKAGSWVYSEHESTHLMCLAVRLPYWEKGRCELWHPAFPELGLEEEGREFLEELFAWIALGGLVEAHNAFFERAIWTNVCVARLGWPPVDRLQWRCSAAKCSVHSLPRDLGSAGAALGLSVDLQKDGEGKKVMLKLCKPRKPRKAEREDCTNRGVRWEDVVFRAWDNWEEDFPKLWDYCKRDVISEEALSEELPDLTPEEQRVWLMDQDMNVRGVLCDLTMAASALKIAKQYTERLAQELVDITGGEVKSPGSRAAFVDWVQRQGVPLPDTQGPTMDKFSKMKGMKESKPHVHRALFIMRECNRTSTAKYDAMLKRTGRDGRLRDLLMYHGAGTGRWSGKGVQVHNFPKGKFDTDLKIANACEIIREGSLDYLIQMYGPKVMEVLSWALRGALMAPDGRELMVADFAAIEARVVLWLARQTNALRVFEEGKCIYCDMATGIYGYDVIKGKHKDERQFGKQAILGLGFEMGFVTFLLTCRKYDITFDPAMARRIVGEAWHEHEEAIRKYLEGDPRRRRKLEDAELDPAEVLHELILMRYTVNTYRSRYPEVTQMWRDQEKAAIAAIRSPGRRITVERGRNTWVVDGRFLKTILPSGRPLYYADPKLVMRPVPWNKEEKRPNITFMGVDSMTKKWVRQQTYGGMLVENITQATARDLMAEAMVAADDHPDYDVTMSVHDELVCEINRGLGDVGEFERMMSATPPWAAGCPVDAEGWRGARYRK